MKKKLWFLFKYIIYVKLKNVKNVNLIYKFTLWYGIKIWIKNNGRKNKLINKKFKILKICWYNYINRLLKKIIETIK